MSDHTPEQRPHWLDYQIKEVCPWCHKPFSIKGYCSAQIAIDQSKEISVLRAQVEEKDKALAKAEKWFTEYAEIHDVKGNRDKAIRNMDRATIMHAAIAATGKDNV